MRQPWVLLTSVSKEAPRRGYVASSRDKAGRQPSASAAAAVAARVLPQRPSVRAGCECCPASRGRPRQGPSGRGRRRASRGGDAPDRAKRNGAAQPPRASRGGDAPDRAKRNGAAQPTEAIQVRRRAANGSYTKCGGQSRRAPVPANHTRFMREASADKTL